MEQAMLAESVQGSLSWRDIFLLASSLWFCFLASLLSARVLLTRALRTNQEEEHQDATVDQNLPFAEYVHEPIQKINMEHQSSFVSTASRYRFLSERDSEGFLQAPEATTMFIKESFVECDSDLYGYNVTDQKLDYHSGAFSESDCDDSSSWGSDEEEKEPISQILSPDLISSGTGADQTSCCPNVSSSPEIYGNVNADAKLLTIERIGEDDGALIFNGDFQGADDKLLVVDRIEEDNSTLNTSVVPHDVDFQGADGESLVGGRIGEHNAVLRKSTEVCDEDFRGSDAELLVAGGAKDNEAPTFPCSSSANSKDLPVIDGKLLFARDDDGVPTSLCLNLTRVSGNYYDKDLQVGDDKFSGDDSYQDVGQQWDNLNLEEMEDDEDSLEDDDIIQWKMEIRKLRSAGALPTIAEDVADLSQKLPMLSYLPLREDPFAALRKLHKGYRERMKKLDMLSNQKISAMGLVQLKNTGEAGTSGGNFWRRRRRCGDGMSERMMKEIDIDLETVYVGQLCLSWEFLHWQYQRTREMVDSRDDGSYDLAASEFQQLQVLIERFLEDEPFQGPRVVNYTSSRRRLRGLLLQIPLFREDVQKKKNGEEEQGGISIEDMEYRMEDSIRILWDFIRAEKSNTPKIIKSLLSMPLHLQNAADHDFAIKVQSLLKKNQKKLKEELQAGTCLVRRFRKSLERKPNEDDLFFAQVDMKLVERVLAMASVTRDQLLWCLGKMKKIHSVEGKLFREPSFMLFPC